jgi:hypothetical protein
MSGPAGPASLPAFVGTLRQAGEFEPVSTILKGTCHAQTSLGVGHFFAGSGIRAG